MMLCFRFGSFETFKSKMVDDNGSLSAKNRVLCGAGTSATASEI